MKNLDHYLDRIKSLSMQHNEHFRAITADGVIDYGESLNTREMLRSYQANLHILKRQAARDLREIHTRYSEQILVAQQSLSGAERAQRVHELKEIRQHHEDAYGSIIERIDFLLVGIPQNSKMIENHIATLEKQMNSQFDDLEDVEFEDITIVFDVLEDSDSIHTELNSALTKWQAILKDIEQRREVEPQTAQQRAYEAGAASALALVITDIADIIQLIQNKA